MPCQGPSIEEIELKRLYLEKLKDPIFLEKEAIKIAESKYQWENGERDIFIEKTKIEEKIRGQNNKVLFETRNKWLKDSALEDISFNSFMSVFLCKAMELIITNNLIQHTYPDMEWWYNEHRFRDINNKSSLENFELLEKLNNINQNYKVTQ